MGMHLEFHFFVAPGIQNGDKMGDKIVHNPHWFPKAPHDERKGVQEIWEKR